jgi:hypothetical protein
MRNIKLSSFGENTPKEHSLVHDWTENGKDISVQGGGSGVVFSKKGGYTTAFFEAFPNNPSCFVRGEGPTIEEAETACWDKWQKILNCPKHEMDRRNRKDGYAYCKHCSYAGMVYEPLTKCCKCGVPTNYDSDFRGKNYCKKHSISKPKSPDPNHWTNKAFGKEDNLPRKLKKKFKEAFLFDLEYKKGLRLNKATLKKGDFRLKAGGFFISPFSQNAVKKYVRSVLKHAKIVRNLEKSVKNYVRNKQKTR